MVARPVTRAVAPPGSRAIQPEDSRSVSQWAGQTPERCQVPVSMSVGDVILGSMDHSARITAFTGLVGPPPGPAPAVDWAAVEGWLGTPLPGDYKALVSAYGAAEIGGPGAAIRLHPPCVSTDGRFEYAAWIVETHRHSAIRPGML